MTFLRLYHIETGEPYREPDGYIWTFTYLSRAEKFRRRHNLTDYVIDTKR